MIAALAKATIEDIRTKHDKKGKEQGFSRDGWVIVDYGDVVLHLFSPDQRDFYNLEELWEDGKVLLRVQ
jgi:ribosome-associated protein